MKARFGTLLMVMVVGVLCVGVVALATDFVWDGDASLCSPSGGWTCADNWVQGSGYPDDGNDNATVADVDPTPTCVYQPGSALTINNLVVTGDSSTWMKLHIRDAALTVHDLELNDFAELDIDHDLTVDGEMIVCGDLRIDVAGGATLYAPVLSPNEVDTELNLTTGGTFRIDSVTMDADTANQERALRFRGGTMTLGSSTEDGILTLISEPGTICDDGCPECPFDLRRGKFWLETGSVVWDADAPAKEVLLHGGDAWCERAEIDLDQDITIPASGGLLEVLGFARIDIASGKTFRAPKLTIGDGIDQASLNIVHPAITGGLEVS